MSGRFWRTPIALGAIAVFALFIHAPPARGNTIQPIFQSVSGPVGGVYTYTYNLQLTPNNGLTFAGGGEDQSGMIILDFNALTAVVTSSGGATSPADWNVSVVGTGAAGLGGPQSATNWQTIGGTLHLYGLTPLNGDVSAADTASNNVVLEYVGGNLTNGSITNENLATLTITSTLAPGAVRQSLDRNTTALAPDQVDTFPVFTAAAPLPSTANMGLALLAGLVGVGGIRRLNSRRALA